MNSDEIVRSKGLAPTTFKAMIEKSQIAIAVCDEEPKKKERKKRKRLISLKLVDGWQELKERALAEYGAACMYCGSVKEIHADHIKPRSVYPELTLCFDNLQVLCRYCNFKKGLSETDYRVKK